MKQRIFLPLVCVGAVWLCVLFAGDGTRQEHPCLPYRHASVAGHMLTTARCLEPTATFSGCLLFEVRGLMSGSEEALVFSVWVKHSAPTAAEELLTPSLTVSPWDCNYDAQKQSCTNRCDTGLCFSPLRAAAAAIRLVQTGPYWENTPCAKGPQEPATP